MDEIIDKSHDFIWIDHHETAEKLPQWSDTNIKGLRLIKYAACHLAWNYFNKNNKMPHTVKLVADRDMWEFKYCEDTHAFHEFCIQFSVIDKYDILTLNDILFENYIETKEIIKAGKTLLRYKLALMKKIIDKGHIENKYKHKTFMCNSHIFQSDIADYVLQHDSNIEIAHINHEIYDKTQHEWKTIVSLRSRKYSDIDVSKIAEKFIGGGGHKHAAGYTSWIK